MDKVRCLLSVVCCPLSVVRCLLSIDLLKKIKKHYSAFDFYVILASDSKFA